MGLNVKYKSVKLLGEKKEKNLWDLGLSQVPRLDTQNTMH